MPSRRPVVLTALTGATLLLVGLLSASWLATHSVDGASEWVRHTHEVIDRLRRLELALAVADAGEHAFIVTGDSGRLADVDEAVHVVPAVLIDLRRLVADNPTQIALLDTVTVLSQRRLNHLHSIDVVRSRAGERAALAELAAGYPLGATLADALRRMETRERDLLVTRLARERRQMLTLRWSLAVSLALGLALTGAANLASRRMRRAIEAQAEEYRAAADGLADGLVRYGPDRRVLFVNRVYAAGSARPAASLVGRRAADVPWPAADGVIDEMLQAVFALGEPRQVAVRTPDPGDPRDYVLRFSPERTDRGGVRSVVLLVSDVTAERTARREHDAQVQTLRAIAAASGAHMFRVDAQLRYLFANEPVAAAVGRPLDEILGRTAAELGVDASARASMEPALHRLFATGARQVVEFSGTPGGVVRHFMACCEPEFGPGREVRSAAVVVHDVTEERATRLELEAEREARLAQAETLRALADASDTHIIRFDREHRYLFLNEAMARTFGRTTEEVLGRTPLEAGAEPATYAAVRPSLERLFATGEPQMVRFTASGPHGTRHLLGRFVPEFDAHGSVVSTVGVVTDVTAMRETELELERQRRFLAATLDQMSDALVVCDARGRLTLMNRVALEMPGLPSGEALPQPWDLQHALLCADGVTPLDEAESPVHRALRGEAVHGAEVVVAPRDGPPRILRCDARQLRDADGKVMGAVATMRDITEQRALERERDARLADGEMLRAVAAATGLSVVLESADGRLLYANDVFARICGRQVEALRGCREEELGVPSRLLAQVAEARARARATGERQTAVVKGTDRWAGRHFQFDCMPQVGDDGEVRAIAMVVTDITLRANAERERDEERQLLATVLEEMREEVVVCDAEGRLTLFNAAARDVLRGDPRTLDAAAWASTYASPGPSARPLRPGRLPLFRALGGETVEGEEIARPGPDGTGQLLVVNARQLRRSDGSVLGALAASRDVTGERRTAEDLRKAQRLEATGRVAAGVAHDFNNILMAMQVSTDLLQLEAGAGPQVAAIRDGIARASAVTGQLLSFCRGVPGAPTLLRLGPWLRTTAPLLRRQLPAGVELALDVAPAAAACELRVDPVQLERALVNLLTNAHEAMAGRGTVAVACGTADVAEPVVHRYGTIAPGTYATIAVSDDGVGMSGETLDQLFEPFYSTKLSGPGRGLGLATVHGIVTEASGSITVASSPGRGACLTLYLPCVDAPRAADAPAAAARSAPARDTFIVVDDDAPVRLAIAAGLEHDGHRVLAAASAAEGLDLLAREDGRVRCVVTDVSMPGMTGIEMVQRLHARGVRLPVVFMTGYMDVEVPTGWLADPSFRFLQKPFAMRSLTEAVAELRRT